MNQPLFYSFCFFFLASFLFDSSLATRSDYISTINSAPNMDTVCGHWIGPYECTSGYAKSFKVLNDYTYFGLIQFHIDCYDWKGVLVESQEFNPNDSYFNSGSWYGPFICGGYLVGYKIYGCCCPHYWNNLGANNIIFLCSGGLVYVMDSNYYDGDTHGWSALTNCPQGTAICGFSAKFMAQTDSCNDQTALNDLKMDCCRICKPINAVYPSGTSCAFCNLNCLTCSSSSTCDSCGGGDTLTSGSCVTPSYFHKVSEEFTGTASTFSAIFTSGGWTGTNSQYSCTFSSSLTWDMVGYYGSATVTKSITNLAPHYKARLKVRFYKINAWTSGQVTMTVNGTIPVSDSQLTSWAATDNFYYGDMCNGGGGSGYEDSFFIDQSFSHSGAGMTVTFHGNPSASAYWGFSHVGVYIYICDRTCLTCSGPATTNCLSCHGHATLTSSGTCVCDNPYYPVTTSTCFTDIPPCTYCSICPTGCAACTSSTACSSCLTNYYLTLGTVKQLILYIIR